MNAGDFGNRLDILEFTEASENTYTWQAIDRVWAKVDVGHGANIFSKTGIAAHSIKLTVHALPVLTLHHALSLASGGGGHCFLTDIDRSIPGFMVLTAALIEPVDCLAERTVTTKGVYNRPVREKQDPVSFPGYLTEKWLRQTQNEPMSYSETRYVLITPKAIDIAVGELVGIGGKKYEVVIPHTLDPYKNEYEVLGRWDN